MNDLDYLEKLFHKGKEIYVSRSDLESWIISQEQNLLDRIFQYINELPESSVKKLFTKIRKMGDVHNQYVVSHRYYDIIDVSTLDEDNVKSKYNDDYCERNILYTYYHNNDDCRHCEEHKKNMRTNPLLGIIIYPKGQYPPNKKEDYIKIKLHKKELV